MERIPRQTVVRNKKTGKKGVTIDDAPDVVHCCSDEETPVVYEGETTSKRTRTEDLEVIGPENAIADMEKCGAGTGRKCCIFLTGDRPGCARFGELRFYILERKKQMKAQREPTEPYPKCQLTN